MKEELLAEPRLAINNCNKFASTLVLDNIYPNYKKMQQTAFQEIINTKLNIEKIKTEIRIKVDQVLNEAAIKLLKLNAN